MNIYALMFFALGLALLLNFWYIVLTRAKMPGQQKLWLGVLNHAAAGVTWYWAYLHQLGHWGLP